MRYADAVEETSQSTGTGPLTLDGVPADKARQTFVQGGLAGVQTAYRIELGTAWENGLGTVTAGPPATLARDSVLGSSSGGALVDWPAGTKSVICMFPADEAEKIGSLETDLTALDAEVNTLAGTVAGKVALVAATAPLASTGGTTPTVSHNASGVTPGAYTAANITVDATGHVTLAEDGASGGVTDHGALTGLADDDHSTVYVSLAPATVTRNRIVCAGATVPGLEIQAAASQSVPLLRTLASDGATQHFAVFTGGLTRIAASPSSLANVLRVTTAGASISRGIGVALQLEGQPTGQDVILPTGRIYGIFDGNGHGSERLSFQSVNLSGTLIDTLNLKAGRVGFASTQNPMTLLQVNPAPVVSYPFTGKPLLLSANTHNGGSTPAAPEGIVLLARAGVALQSYGNVAEFRLSRYENVGVAARTQLDVVLTHGNDDTVGTMVLCMRSSGAVGVNEANPSAQLHVNGTFLATNRLQADDDSTAGNTRLLLWDVNSGALQRVKVGANGTGPGGVGRALYLDDTP